MKLLAVVTLFHPPGTFIDNLLSYAPHVDGLMLWDNTPQGSPLATLPEALKAKTVHSRQGKNVGIGPALNAAATLAMEGGYTHLLTMDQDSCFAPGSFAAYRQAIDANERAEAGRHYAYVPLINSPARPQEELKEVQGFIVSGTIFPVETLRLCGLFKAEFVIDTIDTEYTLRIHRHGGRIMQVPHGSLRHELGQPLSRKILCFRPTSLNYSPMRTYYITRNLLYLSRTCPDFHRRDLLWKLVWERPLYILLIEPQKLDKLQAWLRGTAQGLRKRLGPDPYLGH